MKKTYDSIAKEYLSFAYEHGYSYQYEWKSPHRKISLISKELVITFVELPQFYEKYLYVHLGNKLNQIDISRFNHKSIKSSEEYWELVSESLRHYIEDGIDLMSISKL